MDDRLCRRTPNRLSQIRSSKGRETMWTRFRQ